MQMFQNNLRRYWTRREKTANLVANQQDYQLPEDAVRITGVTITQSGVNYPLEQITSENRWRMINALVVGTINVPTYYFVKGLDVVGIWPIPGESITSGLTVHYEPRMVNMSQDDFSTGTVTVANGSTTVTHSGTGFSQNMIGRGFAITDGSDGLVYRIAGFSSTSVITLENYYQGIGGAGKTFTIGETPIIPEEFHESLADYAAYRYFLNRKDIDVAGEYKQLFEGAMDACKDNYSVKTTGLVQTKRPGDSYNIFSIPPNPIT